MTEYHGTYWNRIGKYQKLFDNLYEELVPSQGNADSEAGEILRVVANLYYDINNNGGCNFDVKRPDRTWLMLNVPKYAEKATKRFIKQPHYTKWLYDIPYRKFLDKYMDWAIKYAEHLHKGESLKSLIPED